MRRIRYAGTAALVAILAVVFLTGAAREQRAVYRELFSHNLTVIQNATLGGDVYVGQDLQLAPQASVVVTDGVDIDPTGTYQVITANTEVTPTLAAGNAGDVLVLINTSNTTVNLPDTGILKLSAALELTQYDSITLVSDGTNWYEVSRSTN